MYTPSYYADALSDPLDFVELHPFGMLVAADGEGIEATHVPFLSDWDGRALLTHVAKANPIWRRIEEGAQALAAFQGPNAYVSPGWYERKPAVPTWNYEALHVRGAARTIHDPSELTDLVARLADRHEAEVGGDWTVSGESPTFIAGQIKAIVGIRIEIGEATMKRKLSQNRSVGDRRGVRNALMRSGRPEAIALAHRMSGVIEE